MDDLAAFQRGKLAVVKGDITELNCDVIVNAANAALCGGGGVDGAIHKAAGPRLLEACRKLGRAKPGDALLTAGFDLEARHVVHAVGPVWSGGDRGERELLASAYRESLARASDVNAKSIAFPSISTGAYRFPFDEAMAIALETVATHLESSGLTRVIFCCFSDRDYDRYCRAVGDRFPSN